MSLCEKCQSMTSKPLSYGRNSLFRHDHISLQEAVFERRCFICTRVWDSLSEDQKAVASGPAFMGIEYQLFLLRPTSGEDGEQREGQEILATLSFKHGEDFYDCEDYNDVGGSPVGSAGCFAILNPSGTYTFDYWAHVILDPLRYMQRGEPMFVL